MQKLPPYGHSITSSQDTIWVYAGEFRHIFKFVKHKSPDTLAIYYPDDPQNYRWPVKGRRILVMTHYYIDEIFKEYKKDIDFLERLALALFMSGAEDIHVFNMATLDTTYYTRS